ncbi:MAG: DUF5615 family PIN-like protein [Candidatus Tectomicrobia bacterium]|uniref:DUF5615 family PIN-like protein n=1 Tax=Tectimicrobiota bacterium TaxID=2528274 RepID=A0A932HXX7_UNCTE|nr:DUF5615 family PIN-like protein [Candidatus Tectomicrobia bacterium]
MRFLADMGVDGRVVRWLREHGHDAAHLRDMGMQRAPDEEVFSRAVSENRILLTFDLDFGEIAALARGRRIGVVIFRLHNTRASHVIERLSRLLESSPEALERGSVVVAEEGRYRIRELPVGGGGGEQAGLT